MASDTTLDLLAPVRRLSVEQYFGMASAGILGEDERIELVEGVVVEMTPIGARHVAGVMWLNDAIGRQLTPGRQMISVQAPIVLRGHDSVPEPVLSVVSLDRDDARIPEQPLLVVEVSASSLGYDRLTKARLYANSGLEEYWIVNLAEETVEVHRKPESGVWQERTVHSAGETIGAVALPGLTIVLGELFAFVGRYPDGPAGELPDVGTGEP